MAVSVPNISVAPSVVHFDDDTDELDNGGENGRRSARRKRRRVTLLNGHRHRRSLIFFGHHTKNVYFSAPEDDYSSGDNDYLNEEALHILNSQLNAERMRYGNYLSLELYLDFRRDTYEEMIHLLRDENDSALRANDALRRDLREMHNAMGEVKNMYERDLDRQRSENTRFKNQVQMQQRKLLSLWKAFCAVKREVGFLLVFIYSLLHSRPESSRLQLLWELSAKKPSLFGVPRCYWAILRISKIG